MGAHLTNSYRLKGLNKTKIGYSSPAKNIVGTYLSGHLGKLFSGLPGCVAGIVWAAISCVIFCSFSDANMVLPLSVAEDTKLNISTSTVEENLFRAARKGGKEGRILQMAQSNRAQGKKLKTAPLIVMIGASFVEGWDVSQIDRFVVVNKGVSGETSSDMLVRFDRDVVSLGPTYVIIWGFINDIHRSERNTIGATLERARANFRAMVDLSRKNGVIPIVATELTIFGGKTYIEKIKTVLLEKVVGKESYRAYVNKHVLQVNEWMKSYAREERIMILDLHQALSGKNGIRKEEYTTPDGTHISTDGYKKLTQYANHALKDLIR